MAAGDEPVRFNRKSADLIGRTIKEFRGRGRGELPLPKRRRGTGDVGRVSPTPIQLAQITALILSGTTPHYSQTPSLSFSLPEGTAEVIVVHCVLLKHGDGADLLIVDNPVGAVSIDELRITATDIRKEGLPKVGDIVRVWAHDGEPISPGESAFNDEGEFLEGRLFLCEPVNSVEELRGLATWDLPTDQLLAHAAATQELIWVAASTVGGEGPPGEPGEPGTPGDVVVPGYGMDTSGTGTVTIINDPTEWTGWSATAYQLFTHLNTATTGTVTDPTWATVTGHDAGLTQLLGHVSGALHAKLIADWLNLLPGYAAGSDQIIGHANGGATEWKTLTSKTVNSPTGLALSLPTATSLKAQVDYTPVTVKLWPAASDGGASNFNDTETGTGCAE